MTAGYRRLVFGTVLLTLVVIVMGAYVRLSGAGLSCPDWPGCYGRLVVPTSEPAVRLANQAFPDRPLVVQRAWKEMIHRYLAGLLGVAIVFLAGFAYRRRADPRQPLVLPGLLVGLVVFQAALGMWTVTLLLKPVVVTAHLLGGMATLALLWWLWTSPTNARVPAPTGVRMWALASGSIMVVQLTLGGWTSANYAALACPDFPTCQGSWWPEMAFGDAFSPWRELGQTSAGDPLSSRALVAIQVAHRAGALLAILIVGGFAAVSIRDADTYSKHAAVAVLALLLVQAGLGVATVLMARPLVFAVVHNATAALLLSALLLLIRWRMNPVT